MDDLQGPSHQHLYVVVKGNPVAELSVFFVLLRASSCFFVQGDNTTAGDAAVLQAVTARLP